MLVSCVAAAAKSLQSCPTLCDTIDGSPQGSPVPGILQARTLEWVAITFSEVALVVKNSLANAEDIRDMGSIPRSGCYAKSLQLCPTLCDPIDGSPQGSPVPGILQARTLEWVAISFSNA